MPTEERRYSLHDLEKDVAVGVKLPLNKKNGGVFEQSYTTEEQAISNLKNLLLTRKGDRFMQPTFGTDVWSLLFENQTPDLASRLHSSLIADIEYWLPYIIVDDLNIRQKLDGEVGVVGNGIAMSLKFRVTDLGANREITLVVSETGTLNLVD